MDFNLLTHKEGHWVYRTADEQLLVNECAVLLNWDLFQFDRWLFDSNNWSMYTRRRQRLMAMRSELSMACAGKAADKHARELLIVSYCMQAWKCTSFLQRRDLAVVRELGCACARAKAIHKTLKLQSSLRKMRSQRSMDASARLLLNTMAVGT